VRQQFFVGASEPQGLLEAQIILSAIGSLLAYELHGTAAAGRRLAAVPAAAHLPQNI
jgi:hypothetical protein